MHQAEQCNRDISSKHLELDYIIYTLFKEYFKEEDEATNCEAPQIKTVNQFTSDIQTLDVVSNISLGILNQLTDT